MIKKNYYARRMKIPVYGYAFTRTSDHSFCRTFWLNTMADTYAEKIAPISDYAIIVNPEDNVAIVKTEMPDGAVVSLPGGDSVTIKHAVPPDIALRHVRFPKANMSGSMVNQLERPSGSQRATGSRTIT